MTQPKHNSDPSIFEPFELEIDQEFIEESKKIDLVKLGRIININLHPLRGRKEEKEEWKYTDSILKKGYPQ